MLAHVAVASSSIQGTPSSNAFSSSTAWVWRAPLVDGLRDELLCAHVERRLFAAHRDGVMEVPALLLPGMQVDLRTARGTSIFLPLLRVVRRKE